MGVQVRELPFCESGKRVESRATESIRDDYKIISARSTESTALLEAVVRRQPDDMFGDDFVSDLESDL